MNDEQQLKLQAYLDGELPDNEMRAVTDWLAQDADARALSVELKHTAGALAGFEAGIKLPETREFYWSKIAREIERQEQAAPVKAPSSFFSGLRRLLIPAVSVAAVVLAVSLIGPQLGTLGSEAEMETAFADANTVTYRDYAGGTTLIWLPYPAENEFAGTEPVDIVD